MEFEKCSECEDLTGRAGRADDSRYCPADDCEAGPFCDECYDKHVARCNHMAGIDA